MSSASTPLLLTIVTNDDSWTNYGSTASTVTVFAMNVVCSAPSQRTPRLRPKPISDARQREREAWRTKKAGRGR